MKAIFLSLCSYLTVPASKSPADGLINTLHKSCGVYFRKQNQRIMQLVLISLQQRRTLLEALIILSFALSIDTQKFLSRRTVQKAAEKRPWSFVLRGNILLILDAGRCMLRECWMTMCMMRDPTSRYSPCSRTGERARDEN